MSSTKSSTIKFTLLGLIIGATVSFFATQFFTEALNKPSNTKTSEAKPLYWVAPMDANYQRDKPGKSPMGMDLIPYYGNQGNSDKDEGQGTIQVSPDVVNNLGVRTAIAEIKALHTQIDTVGYVSYDEDLLVHIHPRVEGWVEKLYVKAIGDPIKKGQPLYDIYSPELVNAQEELLLALDRNNKRLITAAENRLIALQIPKYAIKALRKTKSVQQNVTFYAPQDGVVESLFVREGFYIKPETMMLSLVDLSQVWVKVEIFERDVFKVAMGNSAVMRLDYLPAKKWLGKIEHIHPMLNPKTRTGIVRLHFDNSNGDLKPNMFAQISILVSDDQPVLQVPREAVIRTGTQDRVVLALGDGYFKSVEVKIGRYDQNNIEILSGLSVGEKVVSSAQFLLDSESSKTSDFKRMHHGMANESNPMASMTDMQETTPSANNFPTATVNGTVTSVMRNHRMVTINREAIEKWDRVAASVDFIVAEDVDMSLFNIDAYLMFTFEVHESSFIIISAMPMGKDMPKKMNMKEKKNTAEMNNNEMAKGE